MPMTAAEQYFLELQNRARLDPLAEAARFGIDLNQGLAAGTLTGASRQVLAGSEVLNLAADNHSAWMLATDTFSHTGAGTSTPGDRMTDAGYAFAGSWTWGENIAWSGTTGTMNLEAAIAGHYEGLFRSAGHRTNTLNGNYSEIGIGQLAGQFLSNGTNWNASMLTVNFARTGSSVFVTGVAYDDLNGDAFYSIGEGRGGLTFQILGGASVATATAGGYSLATTAQANSAVRIVNGGQSSDVLVNTTGGNVKLDLVGDTTVFASASITLVAGEVVNVRLLGLNDLSAVGNAAANQIIGNAGANILSTGGGNDTIYGGAGNDALGGGAGNDVMYGGTGNDIFYVDSAGDQTFEVAGEGTADNIYTTLASFSIASLANIEFVTGISAYAQNLTGNSLNNIMAGGAASDVLSGGAGNDTLYGGAGNDILGGGVGNDYYFGGAGNDTFYVDSLTDQIIENAGGGTADTIAVALVNYSMATRANVENLTGLLTTGQLLVGNSLSNIITGNVGADILMGGLGNDTLIGGAGADQFEFNSALGASNVDTIAAYSVADDTIRLENAIFTALTATGALAGTAFVTGAAASTAAHRVVYNSATGQIFYDADGTGAAAQILFATLDTPADLTAADFLVV